MDFALAMKVVRAYEPKSYVHKADKSIGHGFVVEHFAKNVAKHGIDAHALGLVHMPKTGLAGMDYGKATPFLACVVINHEDRIAALEAEIARLKAA
jgi:hypothetical protein